MELLFIVVWLLENSCRKIWFLFAPLYWCIHPDVFYIFTCTNIVISSVIFANSAVHTVLPAEWFGPDPDPTLKPCQVSNWKISSANKRIEATLLRCSKEIRVWSKTNWTTFKLNLQKQFAVFLMSKRFNSVWIRIRNNYTIPDPTWPKCSGSATVTTSLFALICYYII